MASASRDFVHLHMHTEYSLLDGAVRIDDLVRRLSEYGMEAVAITDHGTMFGVLNFYEKTRKAGIKPIIGCEIYVAPRTIHDKTPEDNLGLTHLVLLAENLEGYRNLCRLASIAQLEGFYYRPRIDKTILKEMHHGLIGLSACLHGEIPMHLKSGRQAAADRAAEEYRNIFGDGNFFLEIQNNGIDIQETVNQGLRDMSQRLSLPLVATNDCHYLDKRDVRAHDVLLCVQTGKTVHDSDRFKFRTDQLYLKSKEEMIESFRDVPEALDNTLAIARRCNVEFEFGKFHFPKFEGAAGVSLGTHFESEVRKGFERVLAVIRKKNADVDESVYRERLDYEIKVIVDMGFPGYFLIVADFIRYAKTNGVPVGPGRGSAAGSLVAYSMGITNLDPLEHGLIFERFLNPARKSMPDIDVDFCIHGREDVFQYVFDRYGGGDYVAQIITFGKLKTRAVIRDVGRALGIPLHEVDAIAKLVPDVLNIKLQEALRKEPRLQEIAESRPEIAELMDICKVLEGLPRHASTHAAGVVIGDTRLTEYLPLYRGKKGEVVTQFDMKDVEKIGLVKFDFLGLRNLTVIADTLRLIEAQGKLPPDLDHLDFEDSETYRLLCAGDTTGVFQLESAGMKDLLTRMKPERFEDIIALVALYRPGPLDSGMVDDFVQRKHGIKQVEYLLPELAPILEETYGVIVYQEQVMKIASVLASYTMAEADDLRKAMGKKIAEILAKQRQRFMEGAIGNKVAPEKAEQIFDLIEKFGGYGFNKSHSAAYALIAYQTAYLKSHFPVEFIAALLTSEMNSTDGVVKYISECRDHNISVLPPDVNESDNVFTVDDGRIRFGLVAVKNVGESAIEAIVEERKNGKFDSLIHFCERVDLRKVNRRVIESLITCGAFDCLDCRRSQMMAALDDLLEYGQRYQKELDDPQIGLFETGGKTPSFNTPQLPDLAEWDSRKLLAREKESLGFYVSGHPLHGFEEVLEKFTDANGLSVREMSDGQNVRIGGIITATKVIRTKKGHLMAFITTEDLHGAIETTVFSRTYMQVEDLLVEDSVILILGQLQKDESAVKLIADEIIPMEKAEEVWTASVHIRLDTPRMHTDLLLQLEDLLRQHPGTCKGSLHLMHVNGAEVVVELPENFQLKAGARLRRDVNALLGYPAVETRCGPISVKTNSNGKPRNRINGNNFRR